MMIHEITEKVGRYKQRKRIGRGRGSGHGKTSGRGHKGAGSRSGFSQKTAFEGGQMPFFRRMPKRGFSNVEFRETFRIVNLKDIVEHPQFKSGGDVSPELLEASGLIGSSKKPVKILGDLGESGSLGVKLNIKADRVSIKARKTIEDAGGSVEEAGTRRDRVRGIDRNSGDLTPKNLTKKLKRGGAATKKSGKKKKKK